MTDRERVLRLLRDRGDQGMTPVDFQAPATDGGKPCLRVAARILELKNAGYAIETVQRRPTAKYVLRPAQEPRRPAPVMTPQPINEATGQYDLGWEAA